METSGLKRKATDDKQSPKKKSMLAESQKIPIEKKEEIIEEKKDKELIEEKKELVAPKGFIGFTMITKEFLREFLKTEKLYKPEGKSAILYFSFELQSFMNSHPEYPLSFTKRRLGFKTPFLKMAFGYSPRSVEGNTSNVLRLNLDLFLDPDEGKKFLLFLREIDEYFINEMYEKQREWPLKGLKREKDRIADPKGYPYTLKEVTNGYTYSERDGTGEYPNYMSLHFSTVGVKTTARVDVWNEDRGAICQYLTENNATNNTENINDPNKTNIILGKGDWASCIVYPEKLYFGNTGNGLTYIITDVIVRPASGDDPVLEEKEKDCPF